MRIVPLTLREANDFVEKWHRHSARTSNDGGKYAIGLEHADQLVGVAIAFDGGDGVAMPMRGYDMDDLVVEALGN